MEIKPEFEKIFKEADFKITLFPENRSGDGGCAIGGRWLKS